MSFVYDYGPTGPTGPPPLTKYVSPKYSYQDLTTVFPVTQCYQIYFQNTGNNTIDLSINITSNGTCNYAVFTSIRWTNFGQDNQEPLQNLSNSIGNVLIYNLTETYFNYFVTGIPTGDKISFWISFMVVFNKDFIYGQNSVEGIYI